MADEALERMTAAMRKHAEWSSFWSYEDGVELVKIARAAQKPGDRFVADGVPCVVVPENDWALMAPIAGMPERKKKYLVAENERLRAALRAVIAKDGYWDDPAQEAYEMAQIASDALKARLEE
jgi:hypothetical protein